MRKAQLRTTRTAATRTEILAWAVFAWATGSATMGFFPYPFVGLLSFVLLPFTALGWMTTVRLTRAIPDPAARPINLWMLVLATLVGSAVVFFWLRSIYRAPLAVLWHG